MSVRRPVDRVPRPRRQYGRLALRWIVPIVGGITPVLLISINVAAFMVKHLDQFRWTIAVLAFLSGIMLNSYLALKIYRFAQHRFSFVPQVTEANEEIVIVLGLGAVTIFSFILAWLCYRGLEDPSSLPDPFTFWYGFLQIALPFGYKIFFDWDRTSAGRRRRGGEAQAEGVRGQPAPAPAPTPAQQPPPASSQAGYTPPPWLPPS